MKIRIAGIEPESIVDGYGIRYVIFTQGCFRHCKGCHNPETWDPNGGREVDIEDLIEEFVSDPLITGITLSGGEPFLQAKACAELARAAHAYDLNVWCYTGYTYGETLSFPHSDLLLKQIDVLVDGDFRQNRKSYNLRFRGSSNQRIIYLERGKIKRIDGDD